MENFGVIELASTKTTSTPGWAYVADPVPSSSVSSVQHPTNRKRAARLGAGKGLSLSDQSARQEARVRKELEALDKEGGSVGREGIVIPARKSGQGKHTQNVRKILQSQKTFANHLDDYEALMVLQEQNPTTANRSTSTLAPPKPTSKRPTKPTSKPPKSTPKSSNQIPQDEDTPMPDAETQQCPPTPEEEPSAYLAPLIKNPAESHPGDRDPLLVSVVPDPPTDEELRRLLELPPLSYNQARGRWRDDVEGKYPKREFCGVCGYWGRVRCRKCGGRVCGLGCLEVHREECVTRYGL